MKQETQSRLDAILQKKVENEDAAEAKRREANEAARHKAERQEAVRKRWAVARQEIDGAVSAVNERVAAAKMSFAVTETPNEREQPGLSQLFITLSEEGVEKARQIVFNVTSLGLVQPVTLIPHTGPKIKDFEIGQVDQSYYETVLVDFLDMCVTQAAKAIAGASRDVRVRTLRMGMLAESHPRPGPTARA